MPSIEELRFDPQARAEAMQKASTMPSAHIVALINGQRDECDRSTSAMREQQMEAWRYYQSEVDFSEKEDWQSAVWIPSPWSAVEHAANVLKAGLLQAHTPFAIAGVDEQDKLLAENVWSPILRLSLDKADFLRKFLDAAKTALVTGMSCYLKMSHPSMPQPKLAGVQVAVDANGQPVVHPQYQVRRHSALSITTVEPWKIYRDPASRPGEQCSGSYFIHEESVDRSLLSAQGDIFQHLDEVFSAPRSEGGESEMASRSAKRKGMTWEPHQFRRQVLCTEWYGDILDENGDLVCPDMTCLLANRKTILSGPRDNPLWAVDPNTLRRKWPFVGFVPMRHPFRFEGWGILQMITPLATLSSNLFNLFVDALNWKVNQPTELNTALLDEEDDQEHYPGKLWKKSGDGQLLTPAQIGQMGTGEILAALQFIQGQQQEHQFVNNFVQGTEGTRTQITKGEVQIRTAQSLGMLQGIGQDIEEGGIAAISLAYDLLSQYLTDWTDPALVSIVGPAYSQMLTVMDPSTRQQMLNGNFNYTFSGISAHLQRAELLGRLLQASTIAANAPYLGLTNPSDVLRVIYEALGVQDKITVSEEPMVPVRQVQAMIAGAVSGAPGGPGLRGPTMQEMAPTPTEMTTGATQ